MKNRNARLRKIDLNEMRKLLDCNSIITTRMKAQQLVDKVIKANGLQLQNVSSAEVQLILTEQLLHMIREAREFGLLDEYGEEAYVPISKAVEVMEILSEDKDLVLVNSGMTNSQYLVARAIGCYDYMVYFEDGDHSPFTQYAFLIEQRFKAAFTSMDHRSFSRLTRNQRFKVMEYMQAEVSQFRKCYDTWYVSDTTERDNMLREYISKTYPELKSKFETVI